jgi:hypothetical protein
MAPPYARLDTSLGPWLYHRPALSRLDLVLDGRQWSRHSALAGLPGVMAMAPGRLPTAMVLAAVLVAIRICVTVVPGAEFVKP